MVDREARDKAAQLLQQLLQDGLVTDTELFVAEAWPERSEDTALKAIFGLLLADGGLRMLRSRASEPEMPCAGEGRGVKIEARSLTADGQALFERCALFLKSDLELDPLVACPSPPQPRRGQLRAFASLVLIGGVAAAFVLWGLSTRTAGLLMLWGLLWTLLYHFAEHAVCRPPEGWSIGTVFWPFASRSDYERMQNGKCSVKRET